jgi:hypothetical protein
MVEPTAALDAALDRLPDPFLARPVTPFDAERVEPLAAFLVVAFRVDVDWRVAERSAGDRLDVLDAAFERPAVRDRVERLDVERLDVPEPVVFWAVELRLAEDLDEPPAGLLRLRLEPERLIRDVSLVRATLRPDDRLPVELVAPANAGFALATSARIGSTTPLSRRR